MSFSRREFLLSWLASRLLAAQEPVATPKYSSGVNAVNVLVTVRDKQGRAVANLTKDDFSLEEDGRPQVIQYFARQIDAPLKLGLLVETSGNARGNLDAERRGCHKFVDQALREGPDQAFLIHFDTQVELLQDLTSSHQELGKALDGLSLPVEPPSEKPGRGERGHRRTAVNPGAMLYDAVYLASDEMLRKEQGRKVLILFSGGEDRGSKVSLSEAIEAAQRADVQIFSIRFADPGGLGRPTVGIGPIGTGYPRRAGPDPEEAREVLQRISSETGGAFFETSGSGLDKTFARIEDELRNQYSLGYSSDQHGAGYRLIKVTVKRKNLEVRAREGYYAQ